MDKNVYDSLDTLSKDFDNPEGNLTSVTFISF